MQRIKTLLCCFLAVMGIALCPVTALAGEQSPVLVSLEADREAYEAGDEAIFAVTVTNVSDSVVQDADYEITLPEGMKLIDGEKASATIGQLGSGETFTDSVKAVVATEGVPATGDALLLVPMGIVLGGVGALLVATVFRKRFAAGSFVLLVALVLAGAAVVPNMAARAAELMNESVSASCTVQINGEKREATLSVSYVVPAQDGDANTPNTMTRAEWVARLLEGVGTGIVSDAESPYEDIVGHPYEAAIKTAYAYGILPDDESEFGPDEIATRDYVYSTAVLAAGFSDDGSSLEATDADEADHPGLLAVALDIKLVELDADGNIRPQEPFSVDEADQLIEQIKELSSTAVSGDGGYDYVLQDGVVEIDEYEFDGASSSFVIDEGQFDVAEGMRVALQATENNPYGAAGTVTSVIENGDGTVTVTFEQATNPSQIFVSLRASQTDVSIDSSMLLSTEQSQSAYSIQPLLEGDGEWEPEGGGLKDSFKIDLDDSGSYVSGSFSISPTLGYDIKWTLLGGLEKCDLDVDGEVSITAEAHVQNRSAGKDVELLRAKAPLGWGFSVDVPIYLHVTMEGDLVASVDYSMNTSVRLVNDHWQTKDDSDFNTELSAAIHMRLGGKVGAEFKWFEIQIVDAAVGAGVDGEAKTTVRETGMVCSDLSGYAYADAEVGLKTDYLVFLGWTIDKDILTESNSPFRFKWHWEDGTKVPECTYGKDEPGEPSGGEGGTGSGTIDPNFDGIPAQEDEGWGNEPIWTENEDNEAAISEPFYLEAGTKLTIRAQEDCQWRGMFGTSGNTLVKTTYSSNDAPDIIELSQGVFMEPWDMGDYGSYTFEILSGRLKVWDLEGWGLGTEGKYAVRPTLSFGMCDTIEYPVTLSATSVTMHVGDTYQLSADQTIEDVYAAQGCEYDYRSWFQWDSEDTNVAYVDDAGLITAVEPGTTYVNVSYGSRPNGFERQCKVTVLE